jgi:hypothetical protein
MSNMTEQSFFKDANVQVTTTRVIIGSRTYTLANISSVSMWQQTPSRLPGVLFAAVGTLALIYAVSLDVPLTQNGWLALGVLLVVVGVVLVALPKPKYIVRISSSSGEVNALISPDQNYIVRVVDAINKAIVARG